MYTVKFIKSKLFSRPMLVILTALFIVSVLISAQAPQPVAAVIFNEPDDPIDDNPPDFEPPANGFVWSVPSHYGGDQNHDGLVDTYWRAVTKDYDPAYIYPDTWPMNFYGCQTVDDFEGGGTNSYQWEIDGTIQSVRNCYFTYDFATQGTYAVTMTVTSSDGTSVSFPQEVYIKDYLIVAIGDSLASGEGNPDIPMPRNDWGIPIGDPEWQDKRCHRSANAYPSRAAMAIEYADPHTSVTFISFACSGAAIMTPVWDPYGLQWGWPPLNLDPDPSKYRGLGILGPYIGMETDDYNIATFIPSQIDQLQASLTPPEGKSQRQFDSLIVSAGGNDLHFGNIAMTCLFQDNCYPNATIFETPNLAFNMSTLIWRALTPAALNGAPTSLPDSFTALAAAIEGLNPQPADVYLTQYADQTRGDIPSDPSARFCNMLFDLLYPSTDYGATSSESGPLSQIALYGLDHAILDIVNAHVDDGWHYVDGITSYEVDPDPSKPHGTDGPFARDENGYGHGYCASDNWIVRADESVFTQGPYPLRLLTAGTLHPNAKGIEVIKNRLLYYMLPELEAESPDAPAGDPPVFTSSFTSNGLTSQPGENGWYTHSCDSNQSCAFSRVVLQVTATGSAPLEAANVYVNNLEGCTLPGVSCPTTVITPTNQLVWNFTFLNDGIYQMNFAVSDSVDQISDYVSEIKVDLQPPYSITVPEPFSVDEGSSITLTAVASDTMSTIINLDWDLDYDGIYETADEQPRFSAASLDGPTSKTVRVRATDEAGHFVITTAGINVLNVAPTATINGAPATEEEGTLISLTSTITDPAASDTTFTYEWTVEKDGTTYDSGSDADFSFTPDDNGSYEVSLSVTDDDGDVGTASQTIGVTNVSPVLSNLSGSATSVNEASNFTLSGDLTDPGSADTFELTIDWGDGSTPALASLPTGTTSFSFDHTYADDDPTGTASDTYAIDLSVADDDGGEATGASSVVVDNLPPAVTISAPENGTLYAINTAVNPSASMSDASALDTLTCSVDWADGSSVSPTLSGGVCSASHVYNAAGVYIIEMTGADDDTGATTDSVMVVVYDPSAGFVTGGGWISSPAGAYKPDESLAGKATFGFVSKYKRGETIPTGNTAFNFDLAGMAFASQSYEWLIVNQGGTNAQFKGAGMINGMLDPNSHTYKFMVWAGDGSPDTFRIRIWWEDTSGEHDVYDNGISQPIGGGSIVVHTGR